MGFLFYTEAKKINRGVIQVKKQLFAWMLAVLMLLALSGCQVNEQTNEEQIKSSFSESSQEDSTSESGTEDSSETTADSNAQISDTEESDTNNTASPVSGTVSDAPVTEKPAEANEFTVPAETEKATEQPTRTPTPTEQPATEPEAPAPQPTEEPTQEPEPSFDINYWISYAKSYAESCGLTLDSSATECWDNPISAGPKCTSTESSIISRLNRYAKDGDITSVWVSLPYQQC